MRFKQWLLQEMAHLILPKPIMMIGDNGRPARVSFIDMRFEDYPNNSGKHYVTQPFKAALPVGKQYLVYDGRTASIVDQSQLSPAQTPLLTFHLLSGSMHKE